MAAFPIRRGATMNIYVPTRERITLSLAATPPSVPPGHPVMFRGRLADLIIGADTLTMLAPMPAKKVTLWRTVTDPIEGTIQQQEVGAAVTDENGTFGIDNSPLVTADYNAIAVAADDQTVLAMSSLVTVEVG